MDTQHKPMYFFDVADLFLCSWYVVIFKKGKHPPTGVGIWNSVALAFF